MDELSSMGHEGNVTSGGGDGSWSGAGNLFEEICGDGNSPNMVQMWNKLIEGSNQMHILTFGLGSIISPDTSVFKKLDDLSAASLLSAFNSKRLLFGITEVSPVTFFAAKTSQRSIGG